MSIKKFTFLFSTCLVGVAVGFHANSFGQVKRKPLPPSPIMIDGVLLKSSGKPKSYMELQLVPVDSENIVNDSRLIAVSDARGRFAFRDVPDGQYTLSVKFDDKPTQLSPYSTFFFPSTENRKNAQVIGVNSQTRLKGLTFKLPPELVNRMLSGKVVWDDNGEPIANAWIACIDIDFDFDIMFGRHFSRPDGSFTFDAFTGRRYQAAAIVVRSAPDSLSRLTMLDVIGGGETDVFKLDAATQPIEIRLRRFKESTDSKRLLDKYVGVTRFVGKQFS